MSKYRATCAKQLHINYLREQPTSELCRDEGLTRVMYAPDILAAVENFNACTFVVIVANRALTSGGHIRLSLSCIRICMHKEHTRLMVVRKRSHSRSQVRSHERQVIAAGMGPIADVRSHGWHSVPHRREHVRVYPLIELEI